jgi:hypothetical protein
MMTEHDIQRIMGRPEMASESEVQSISNELLNLRQNNRHLATQVRAQEFTNVHLDETIQTMRRRILKAEAIWRGAALTALFVGAVSGYALAVM